MLIAGFKLCFGDVFVSIRRVNSNLFNYVKEAIGIVILTNPGERVMLPEFGRGYFSDHKLVKYR